ncbi:hypothetical protein PCK1_002781 [Pneumocystis canis]|nr:hypothetical protein PCK1_002781 [Pneumocystis canis]
MYPDLKSSMEIIVSKKLKKLLKYRSPSKLTLLEKQLNINHENFSKLEKEIQSSNNEITLQITYNKILTTIRTFYNLS